jgi:hypothetical protein
MPRLFMHYLAPKSEIAFSKIYMDLFAQGNAPAIKAHTDPELYANLSTHIQDYHAYFQEVGNPDEIKLIGFNSQGKILKKGRAKLVRVSLEYHFPNVQPSWFLATLYLYTEGDTTIVTDIETSSEEVSYKAKNDFVLRGRTFAHYAVLLCAALSFALCLGALILCLRDASLTGRRRIAWAIVTILGVCAWDLNWTTGELTSRWMVVGAMGGAYSRVGLYGPWTLTAYFPLGALIYLYGRTRKPQDKAGT